MTSPTNPTNPGNGASGGATGSASTSVAADPESPWHRAPVNAAQFGAGVRAEPGEDTATTTSLPAIGGPQDPYAGNGGPGRPVAPPSAKGSAPKAPAPKAPPAPPTRPVSRPLSAVDQYAALADANAATVAVASSGHPGAAAPRGRAAGPGIAAPAGAVPLPGAVPAGAPGAPGIQAPPVAKVRPAKAIRKPKTGSSKAPRRARLQIRHFNVWSVLRFSCVLAIALFFVWLIMVGVLYGILDVTHVFSKVNETVRTINGDDTTKDVVTPGIVFGGAFIIGLINIVLFIALTTIGSVVYNLCADLVGGIEVTLSEHE
jgi:hypothetical protein